MDNADFVTELTLKSMEEGLAARRAAETGRQGASMFCVEVLCKKLIPWQRRFAVTNCVRCKECQMVLEGQGVGHAG